MSELSFPGLAVLMPQKGKLHGVFGVDSKTNIFTKNMQSDERKFVSQYKNLKNKQQNPWEKNPSDFCGLFERLPRK